MLERLSRTWPWGLRSSVGVFAAIIGLGIIYFGFGAESPKKEASARVNPTSTGQQKPVRAMNLALGDMVFLAQELGFSIAPTKDDSVSDPNKITTRIEGQLQGIREIYRRESGKNSSLVGAVILQFNITPSGEVTQVKELSARLNDVEFKRAILAETAKWSFTDLASEHLIVTCPLLFVHEGMDITTLVRWEKSLGNFADKIAAPRLAANVLSAPQIKSSDANVQPSSVANNPAEKPKPSALAKSEGREFQIKYATLLRKDPNFTAASMTSLTIGTKVTVLRRQGDWLEVRANQSGPTGFIRKEFVTPVDVARK